MATRIIVAEANTDAPKPLRGVPDGSGYRVMARSESSAQELGRPADRKPTAGVGRGRTKAFRRVNHYMLRRMARFLNRKSQRHYRLKYADTYYGELNHMGLYWLKWAHVRILPKSQY